MKKTLLLFPAMFLTGALFFPQTAFALSSFQIEAILNLLRAFDVDTPTVNTVSNILEGEGETVLDVRLPDETGGVETFFPDVRLPDETGGVETQGQPAPTISFSASPSRIERGQQTNLSWRVINAISCSLSEPQFEVETHIQQLDDIFEEENEYPTIYSLSVAPQATTPYTLTCTGVGGQVSSRVIVEVVDVITADRTKVVDGHNLYSADLVIDGGETWMYFGGWLSEGQVHDNIYRAECTADGTICSNIQPVILAEANGFNHLNDPSIIKMPGDYYIMYMTGVKLGEDGLTASKNHLYFSTSWVGDGVTWSKPQLLIENHWLPSAVFEENGEVSVYANDNIRHGKVVRMNMGLSGVGFIESQRVDYGTEDTDFNNVEVVRNTDGYVIAAERPTFPGSEIDLFVSEDGLHWERTQKGVITAATGENRVGTPTFHPTDANSIFFGSTARSDSTGFKIYNEDISQKVSSTQGFLQTLSAAVEKARASVLESIFSIFGR